MLEEAIILFNIMEDKLSIPNKDYERYIVLSERLTGKKIGARRCIRRVKRAHAYLSDYLKGL